MKLAWKPVDIGGLRLYQVIGVYPPTEKCPNGDRCYYIVAAKAPRHAAEIVRKCYKDCKPMPTFTGKALNVLIPAEWWWNGIPCIHETERWKHDEFG